MRGTTLLIVVALVTLPCVAMAQYGMGAYGEESNDIRLRVGWFDMGDADTGLGIGADYMFRAMNTDWVVGGEWGDADGGSSEMSAEAQGQVGSIDSYWGVTINWIARQDAQPTYDNMSPRLYFGGGVGYYGVTDGTEDEAIGYQALLGVDFGEDWFIDGRWVLGTEMFDDTFNVDGPRLSIGFRFK